MATLRKLLFFSLALVILGAGGYAQTKFDYTLDLAQQGNASAQVNLGVMYHTGEGVPRDYQEAAKWFRRAADQGDADAQFNLGLSYEKGEGVPRDFILAHMWWDLSLSKETDEDRRKEAAEWLNDLEKEMIRAQISEAQRLAREWKPKGKKE